MRGDCPFLEKEAILRTLQFNLLMRAQVRVHGDQVRSGVVKIKPYCSSFHDNIYTGGLGEAEGQGSLYVFTYFFPKVIKVGFSHSCYCLFIVSRMTDNSADG